MFSEFPAIIAEYRPEGENAAVEFTMLFRGGRGALFKKDTRTARETLGTQALCGVFSGQARTFFEPEWA